MEEGRNRTVSSSSPSVSFQRSNIGVYLDRVVRDLLLSGLVRRPSDETRRQVLEPGPLNPKENPLPPLIRPCKEKVETPDCRRLVLVPFVFHNHKHL